MSNVELLKKGYQYFAEGNIEGVLTLLDPEIEWNECKGFPFIENEGTYIGHQAVVENIFAQIPAHYDGFNIDIVDIFESGDKVVMEGYYLGAWKATGKKFRANAAHIWTLKDGIAIRFFQAVDTATIIG